jgi:hypothetical protein
MCRRRIFGLMLAFAALTTARAQAAALPPEAAAVDEIFGRVTAIDRDPHGRVTVTLDNGQVWQQGRGDAIAVSVGSSVTVKRGPTGTYHLIPETTRRSYQVRRVQ